MNFRFVVVRWLPAGAYWGCRDSVCSSRYLRFDSACHAAATIQATDPGAVATVVELAE